MTRVLILGGTGMLGQQLCSTLGNADTYVVATTVQRKSKTLATLQNYKNVGIYDQVTVLNNNYQELEKAIIDFQPQIIINAIAITKTKNEPLNKILAVNSNLPHTLLRLCAKNLKDFFIIHISTDGVFDGSKNKPYEENDTPDATDSYGKSKIAGEITNNKNVLCVRTSIYGPDNFKKTGIYEWLIHSGKKISGYNNVFFNGLTTKHLSEVIMKIINLNDRPCGVLHIHSNRISKYDLLCLLNKHLKLGKEVEATTAEKKDLCLASKKNFDFKIQTQEEMIQNL